MLREKEFDNQDNFNKYIEENPELKKIEKDFEKIELPKSFDDIDKKFFWDIDKKK